MTPPIRKVEVTAIPVGNLGNCMFQYMVLETLRKRLAPELDLSIQELNLGPWGVIGKPDQERRQPALRLTGQYVSLPDLERVIRHLRLSRFEFASLGFRMSNLLEASAYESKFTSLGQPTMPFSPERCLLINVRGAEILANTHPDYGPIPISFYTRLLTETGLQPVFMGQIGDDPYSRLLREAFPNATFLGSLGAEGDFELLRHAKHVVASVSSFSWLATWFSRAETIHLPVLGMFNPHQRPDIDLLPASDPRYRFYRFPIRHWRGTQSQFDELRTPIDCPPLDRETIKHSLAEATAYLAPSIRTYGRRIVTRTLLFRWLQVGGRVTLKAA